MKIINNDLIESVVKQAKESPRLRMNYNFHDSLDDKCHRMLNALEPGTQVPIHHHMTKDESFILLRGKVRVNIYNDAGEVTETIVLCHADGNIGVDIPKDTWYNVEFLKEGNDLFQFILYYTKGY